MSKIYTNYSDETLIAIQPGDKVQTKEEVTILLSRQPSTSKFFLTEMKWLLPNGKIFKVDYNLNKK